jgi:hypothetical protein
MLQKVRTEKIKFKYKNIEAQQLFIIQQWFRHTLVAMQAWATAAVGANTSAIYFHNNI